VVNTLSTFLEIRKVSVIPIFLPFRKRLVCDLIVMPVTLFTLIIGVRLCHDETC
jgi:hypothetical protein